MRPWDSLDAAQAPAQAPTRDRPEQVRKCLNCPYPDDCHPTLCARGGPGGAPGRPRKRIDEELARRLYQHGYSDERIGRCLGVSGKTIGRWRRLAGLPVNKDYWSAKRAMG